MSETGPGIATAVRIEAQSTTFKEKISNPNPEVFTFRAKTGKAVNAIFYSAQEIPTVSDPMKDKKVFVYGEKPKKATDQEWFDSQEAIRNSSLNKNLLTKGTYWWDISEAMDKENALFMVEATPKNVLDLAFTLGVESRTLRNLRAELSRGHMTDEVLDFTDAIIAGKIVGADGKIRTDANFDGEAVMVRALTGDIEAEQELKKRQQIITELDQRSSQEEIEELKADLPDLEKRLPVGEKPIEPKDLALVRVVPDEPTLMDGKMVLQTVFDRSGFIPRPTLHFTLNHLVGAHSGGDWTGTQVTIVSPFDKAVELNGSPISINTSDTFFAQTPGRAFVVPEGSSVIKPGKTQNAELFKKVDDTQVVYKTKDFTPADIQKIESDLDKRNPQIFLVDGQTVATRITSSLGDQIQAYWLQQFGIGKNPDYESKEFKQYWARSGTDISAVKQAFKEVTEEKNLFEVLKDKPITELLTDFKTLLDGKVDGGISLELEALIKNAIEVQLGSEVQTLAVQTTMEEKGYKWMTSGAWGGFHNSLDRLKFDILAAQLGIPQRPHDADPNLKLEGFLGTSPEDGVLGIYKDKREDILTSKTLTQINPASRRMLYQMGLL